LLENIINKSNQLTAYFFPHNVVLKDNSDVFKAVSYSGFLNMFKSEVFCTPLLPSQTKLYFSCGNYEYVLLERPASPATLVFVDKRRSKDNMNVALNIQLPTIMFFIKFRTYAQCVYAFSLKQPLTNLDEPIFRIPLPNVNPDISDVCLADVNERFNAITLERADKVIDLFLGSVFNSDYFSYSIDFSKLGYAFYDNYIDVLKNLSERDAFPVDALLPFNKFKTLKQMLNHIVPGAIIDK
jgi:hypothetical protein